MAKANISSMSLQKAQSRVLRFAKSHHLAHTPVMSIRFVQTHIPACKHVLCYSHKILKEDKIGNPSISRKHS